MYLEGLMNNPVNGYQSHYELDLEEHLECECDVGGLLAKMKPRLTAII